MVKYKKLFILTVFCFLLCGCNVDYNISINKDLSVDESFTALEEKEKIIQQRTVTSFDELIEDTKKQTTVDTDKYLINKYKTGSLYGAKVSRNYSSVKEYVNNINKYDLFKNKTTYNEEEGIVTLKLKTDYFASNEYIDILYEINAKVNIKLPYKVTQTNADYIDEKKNMYSWDLKNYLDSTKSEDILLVFDTSEKVFTTSDLYLLIALICIFVLAVVAAIIGNIKMKKNNRI